MNLILIKNLRIFFDFGICLQKPKICNKNSVFIFVGHLNSKLLTKINNVQSYENCASTRKRLEENILIPCSGSAEMLFRGCRVGVCGISLFWTCFLASSRQLDFLRRILAILFTDFFAVLQMRVIRAAKGFEVSPILDLSQYVCFEG